MSLKVTSDSAYYEMLSSDKRIPNNSLDELVPNITLSENTSSETLHDDQSDNIETRMFGNPEKQIQSAISKVNNELKFRGTKCEFTYFDDINRVAIKVLDKETNEVIREIPPEETIKLIQKLWEFAGLLFDEKG